MLKEMTFISAGRLKEFVRLLRPHFLLGSVMLFLIGSTYENEGQIDITAGLMMAVLTTALVQLAGQLADDYFDRDGDMPSRRSLFAGGSGVIQSGSFTARNVLWMTISVCAIAILLATVVAAINDRWLLPPLIALGLAGGLAYSMPPARLASTWFGELSIALLLGLVLPITGSYYAQGTLDLGILVVCLPLFFFSLESLVAVEFPDMEADRTSGKRNLTYRLGIQRSKYVQVTFLSMGYLAVTVEVLLGLLDTVAMALLVTLPLSAYSSWRLIKMKDYDFEVSKTASNMAMIVNGISMAILLVYAILISK